MVSYKLIAPGFPRFVPVSHTKPPGRWREWGKTPTPSIVSLGLPRASQAESESYLQRRNVPASARDENPTSSYPRAINEIIKGDI
jgi:hypothetical protein